MTKLGEASVDLIAGTAKFLSDMQGAHGKFSQIGSQMMGIGRSLSLAITTPLIAAGAAGLHMSLGFETSMARIQGLVGIAAEEIERLGPIVEDMAVQFGRSGEEAADALYFITSAGIDTTTAMEVLEVSLRASATGLGATTVVADLLSSAINAYGKENLSSALAADQLTAAVRVGKLEADALSGTMGRVLPVASAMGVSFDEVAAAMAAMSRSGTDANEGATQLRGILASILNPSKDAAKAMVELGLSAEGLRTQIDERGLLSVLETLASRIGDNDEITGRIFGNIRALTGVMNMMGVNAAATGQIFADVAVASGDLGDGFEVIADTAQFKLNVALSGTKAALKEVGDILAPVLIDFTVKLNEVTGAFREMDPEQQKMIIKIGVAAAALGPLLIGLGALAAAIGAIMTPVGLAIAAIAALGTAAVLGFGKLRGAIEDWKTAWNRLFGTAEEETGQVSTWYMEMNEQVGLSLQGLPPIMVDVGVAAETMADRSGAAAETMRTRFSQEFRLLNRDITNQGRLLFEGQETVMDDIVDLEGRHWRERRQKTAEGFVTIYELQMEAMERITTNSHGYWIAMRDDTVQEVTTMRDAVAGRGGIIDEFGGDFGDRILSIKDDIKGKWDAVMDLFDAIPGLENWRKWADNLIGIFNPVHEKASKIVGAATGEGGGVSGIAGDVSGAANIVGDLISGGLAAAGAIVAGVLTIRSQKQGDQAIISQLRIEGAHHQGWAFPRLDLLGPIKSDINIIAAVSREIAGNTHFMLRELRSIEANTADGGLEGASGGAPDSVGANVALGTASVDQDLLGGNLNV